MRAFAHAGSEVAMLVLFFIASIAILVSVSRWISFPSLLNIEGQIIGSYSVRDSERLDRIERRLEKAMPKGGSFDLTESFGGLGENINQRVVAEIRISNISAPFHWFGLEGAFWQEEKNVKSLSKAVSKFQGPQPGFFAFLFHLFLLPWLLVRFFFLPKKSPPMRPVVRFLAHRKRLIIVSLVTGLFAGVFLSLIVHAADRSGVITFSDQMPSLEFFGVTSFFAILGLSVAVMVAGFLEETLFRGLLLRPFFENAIPVVGIIVCAFWFTAAHGAAFSMHSGNLVYLFLVLIAGLVFGWMTLRYQSWVPAGIAHAGYNFSVTLTVAALS
mgnify:FL=1